MNPDQIAPKSDLGPYCLQFMLPKNISRQEEQTTSGDCQFFFVLILYIPVKNFSVMSGWVFLS